MKLLKEQQIQNSFYRFPYHYIVKFKKKILKKVNENGKYLKTGLENMMYQNSSSIKYVMGKGFIAK